MDGIQDTDAIFESFSSQRSCLDKLLSVILCVYSEMKCAIFLSSTVWF